MRKCNFEKDYGDVTIPEYCITKTENMITLMPSEKLQQDDFRNFIEGYSGNAFGQFGAQIFFYKIFYNRRCLILPDNTWFNYSST